jgi:hypothetical protein
MPTTYEPSDTVFLLGAGASKAAGVPDTHEFVEVFRQSIDGADPDAAVLDAFLKRLAEWRRGHVDIELLLDALTRVAERDRDPGVVFCRDPALADVGAQAAAGRLAGKLRDCIKTRTYVEPDRTTHLDPLMHFIRHHGVVDVATLNYDTVIEEFGYRNRVHVHDGFQPDWNVESLREASSGIRLYKLHGSVTWYQTGDGRHVKERVRVDSSKVRLVQAESAESLMLYPVRKWAYSEPMVGLLFEFKRILESPAARFLVIVGYSFRDDHVQGVIRDAARNNDRLELVIVDPSAYGIRKKLFDDVAGPGWPAYLRRRVLCLPYRFESVLPLLKHEYLLNLRTAVGGEADAEAAVARGTPPLHWQQAAQAFGECQHSVRLDQVMGRGRPFGTAPFQELRARLLVAANMAIGGDDHSVRDAMASARQAMQDLVVKNLTCRYEPPSGTRWFQRMGHGSIDAAGAADQIEACLPGCVQREAGRADRTAVASARTEALAWRRDG